MATILPEILYPELFIGFVAPIGADIATCVKEFRKSFESLKYTVVEVRVTDVFDLLSEAIKPNIPLVRKPESSRYESYISYGNQLRETFEDDAVLATITVARISRLRPKITLPGAEKYSKIVYLIHQFKRREEIEILRSVYGRQFFQVSVYSRRGARVDHLSHKFANTDNSANINSYRSAAESIIQIDQDEHTNIHGQSVLKIFHDGDFIVNLDSQNPNLHDQIDRFCNLIFGSNRISPTKIEYGMFIAKAAALRTLDLSRQVGAAIFQQGGEIVTLGSNEVPKGGGGTYWCDEIYDDREYKRNHDSNDRRKKEILAEILNILNIPAEREMELKDSQFMDALEYGRIVHAEMSAIMDAARLGKSVKDTTLFCTTFPCHMCAKHIVSAGIKNVYFLEPYPKSLVMDLHSDSIVVEGSDRGKYTDFPATNFEHFHGVSPRRFRELFERTKRKDAQTFREWQFDEARPNLRVIAPYYSSIEKLIVDTVIPAYQKKVDFDFNIT